MKDEYSERELELGLVRNIERFLLEMGSHFTFVGRQHRIEVDGDEFFVDLLLFHRGQLLFNYELHVSSKSTPPFFEWHIR